MGTAPWGPHGPQVPANTVTPNPTQQVGPGAQIGGGDAGTFTPSTYTGGGRIGILVANILFSLILLAYLWEVFVCLYPLTAFTGLLASFLVAPMVALVLLIWSLTASCTRPFTLTACRSAAWSMLTFKSTEGVRL